MSSDDRKNVNRENAQHSTGPRTPEGKATSSQNAVTHVLFAARDFVLPEEVAEYESTRDRIWKELAPSGILEETFALSVITATWRLRRCGLIEALMVDTIGPGLDPMEDQRGARLQASVDRARMSSHKLLCQSLAEIRRLQTDRATRDQIFAQAQVKPPANLISWDKVVRAAKRMPANNSIQKQIQADIDRELADLASFCDDLDSVA